MSRNKISINQNIKTDKIDKIEHVYDCCKEIIKRNIGYEDFTAAETDIEMINETVELMTEAELNRTLVKAGSNLIPSEIVKKTVFIIEL